MELQDVKVAILLEDRYKDVEFWYPLLRLREAGAEVTVVGADGAKEYTSEYGYPVTATVGVNKVMDEPFAALVAPGRFAPDRPRRNAQVSNFMRNLYAQGAVVAMVCHAGWLAPSAEIVQGKQVAAVAAVREELTQLGATVVGGGDGNDEDVTTTAGPTPAVVQDRNLLTTAGGAEHLPDFCRRLIQMLQQEEDYAVLTSAGLTSVAVAEELEDERK
ncbi:MAG: DJ-1/PfpI family protein [Caldilineaceae bacterium]